MNNKIITHKQASDKIKELEAERKPVAEERKAMRVASGGKAPKSAYSTLELMTAKSILREASRIGSEAEIKVYTDLIDKIEKDLNLEKRYNILGAKLTRIDTELPELYKEIRDNTALIKTFKAKGGSTEKDILNTLKNFVT